MGCSPRGMDCFKGGDGGMDGGGEQGNEEGEDGESGVSSRPTTPGDSLSGVPRPPWEPYIVEQHTSYDHI